MINIINNISCMWWNWMAAMFWQVGLFIIIVACIDTLVKRWAWPQLRYALWLLVLVKLVLPPGISMPGSFVERVKPGLGQLVSYDTKEPSTIKYSPFIISSDSIVAIGQETYRQPQVTFEQQKPEPDVFTSSGTAPESPNVGLIWQSYAMTIWFFGMAALGFSLIRRLKNLRACQSRAGSTPVVPQSFHLTMSQCARQLKLRRIPGIVVTRNVVCPAVFGIFRPVLLMPKGCLKKLSRKDAEHVLLHELAHIKRGDPIVHCFYLILQIVYWFNPLLWIVRRQLIHLRELCCDATVARILKHKTNAYRQTLIDIAGQFLTRPLEPGLGLLGLFEDANKLLVRLSWLEKKTWRYKKMKTLTIITVITLMIAFVLPMAEAREESSADNTTKNTQLDENLMSYLLNNNDSEAMQAESKEQLSEQMKILKVQLEKLEIEKQNLQKEMAKLEKSNQKVENEYKDKMKEKSADLQKIAQKAEQWQNNEEFKLWQQQMQLWNEQMRQWSQQLEHSAQGHGTTGSTPDTQPQVLPMPKMPPMPPMPELPQLPKLSTGSILPGNVPQAGLTGITVPSTGVSVNPSTGVNSPVHISTLHPGGLDIHISENDNGKIKAVREMELFPKIEPGASFVVQDKVGNIFLSRSQDGKCTVKAVISATAENTEEAQKMAEQTGMENISSSERFFLKMIRPGDDKWQNINVDLYITIPSNITLDISTEVGSIEIKDITGEISAQTNTGSVKAVNIAGEIQLVTKVGNIDFTAPNDLSAKIQANTKVGSIDSEFPLDVAKTSITASTAKGTIGSGEKNIRLITEVGKISIKKQSSTGN